ncbi:MAG TPA: hypothetical protein VE422_41950 [Terriglobia bacterium]|nr:hypothetical protein [Terriglobia bacterium]
MTKISETLMGVRAVLRGLVIDTKRDSSELYSKDKRCARYPTFIQRKENLSMPGRLIRNSTTRNSIPILSRLRDRAIPFRNSPHGPMDMMINTENGGKNLYWFDPDGHNWEILTVSYARPATSLSKS